MELIFEEAVTVTEQALDEYGKLKLSAMLGFVQQVSGSHCSLLGFDWQTMARKELFWAVLRHRLVIHSLPRLGQTVILRTWPMPTTRVAYPRAVQALSEDGTVLFEAVSLWVLMHTQSRTMVRVDKCGVEVPGILRGCELESPGPLAPQAHTQRTPWTVTEQDLDINRHVNNTRYLDHAEALAGEYRREHTPRELTVCYLSECRLGQQLQLGWSLHPEGVLTVDGYRTRTDVPGKTDRVFVTKILYR